MASCLNLPDSRISAMSLRVAFFVLPGFELLDLSGPLCAFEFANFAVPGAYHLAVVSETGGPTVNSCNFAVHCEPCGESPYDTVIVTGGPQNVMSGASPETIARLSALAGKARRVASVCTGAFLLASTGLLDGKRATTHWRFAAQLQSTHPRVRVDADRIFIQDGNVWTSAGITAGIDLALALIEDDLGAEASRWAARNLVVYHRRHGGQTQFSALLDLDPPTDRVRRVLTFAREHLHEELSVERLAEVARLSPRQFARVFLADTGQTPGKAVDRLRAEAARPRVEDGLESLEAVARAVGFGDPERMRQSFIRNFGQPPQALRRLSRSKERREAPPGSGETAVKRWRKMRD
jgi:transcriptional regulator GlxA family with amidase domain